MRARALFLALALALAAPIAPMPPAFAVEAGAALDDPRQEARARALFKELRCLVCQNQSIDDSEADLARDLRMIVREHIEAGASDEEIRAFLTARYGDFVLLEPPVVPKTWALWFAPFLLLVAGAGALLVAARRRRAAPAAPPLSADERARLESLLGGNDAETER